MIICQRYLYIQIALFSKLVKNSHKNNCNYKILINQSNVSVIFKIVCGTINMLEKKLTSSSVSFHSNPKERQCQRMLKLLHNCTHFTHLQCNAQNSPGFNSTWTMNFKMFKMDLEKAEKLEIKFPTSMGSSKKQESSRKTSISALLTMPKLFIVWITTNYGKFFKRRKYQTTWPASWEICMQVRKQFRIGHGTIDWLQIRKGVH